MKELNFSDVISKPTILIEGHKFISLGLFSVTLVKKCIIIIIIIIIITLLIRSLFLRKK